MSTPSAIPTKKTDFKYKIGKIKQMPSVQVDPKTNLSYIELKSRNEEIIYGCTTFNNHYKEEKKLGQGTFGAVYKGIHLETQRQVAMKRIIVTQEKDLFPITAQREITILRKLNNKHIIKLIEMVYDNAPESGNNNNTNSATSKEAQATKAFYMILPYMIADLSGLLHNPRIKLPMGEIKNMMLQLLEGINYLHCKKFMHRDIKTANILIDHTGTLKLADFGLARMYYGSPPNLKYPGGAGMGAKYTGIVVTRWYRAPELVLGDKQYTTAVDIWGIGCVFAEFFEKKPVLQGSSDIDQGHVIFKLLGTPTKESWEMAAYLPGAELVRTNYPETLTERFGKYLTETGLQFLKSLLSLNPYDRLTAMSAMNHPFFSEDPLPSKNLTCLTEESHEADIKRYKEEMHQALSQKAPTAPKGHIEENDFEADRSFPVPPTAPAGIKDENNKLRNSYYGSNTNNTNNYNASKNRNPNHSQTYRPNMNKANFNRYNNSGNGSNPNMHGNSNSNKNYHNHEEYRYNNHKMTNPKGRYNNSYSNKQDPNLQGTYNTNFNKNNPKRFKGPNDQNRKDGENGFHEGKINKYLANKNRDSNQNAYQDNTQIARGSESLHSRIGQNTNNHSNITPNTANKRFEKRTGNSSESYSNRINHHSPTKQTQNNQITHKNSNNLKDNKKNQEQKLNQNIADFY